MFTVHSYGQHYQGLQLIDETQRVAENQHFVWRRSFKNSRNWSGLNFPLIGADDQR